MIGPLVVEVAGYNLVAFIRDLGDPTDQQIATRTRVAKFQAGANAVQIPTGGDTMQTVLKWIEVNGPAQFYATWRDNQADPVTVYYEGRPMKRTKKIEYLHYVELCQFYEVDPAIAFESAAVRAAVKAGDVAGLIAAIVSEF
jgi:hypothetical protein